MAGCINDELDRISGQTNNRNEQVEHIAKLIDSHIHKNFNITPENKIAYDEIWGGNAFAKEYSAAEKENFDEYLDKQIRKIDLENKDRDFLRHKMLEMYANPLKNYLAAQ